MTTLGTGEVRVVEVINTTTSDIPAFSTVEIDSSVSGDHSTVKHDVVHWNIKAGTGTIADFLGVVQNPIRAGEAGHAVVSGPCTVLTDGTVVAKGFVDTAASGQVTATASAANRVGRAIKDDFARNLDKVDFVQSGASNPTLAYIELTNVRGLGVT